MCSSQLLTIDYVSTRYTCNNVERVIMDMEGNFKLGLKVPPSNSFNGINNGSLLTSESKWHKLFIDKMNPRHTNLRILVNNNDFICMLLL